MVPRPPFFFPFSFFFLPGIGRARASGGGNDDDNYTARRRNARLEEDGRDKRDWGDLLLLLLFAGRRWLCDEGKKECRVGL